MISLSSGRTCELKQQTAIISLILLFAIRIFLSAALGGLMKGGM